MKQIEVILTVLLSSCLILSCGGYRLTGKVLSDDGQPLSGATVEMKDINDPEKVYKTTTQKDGSYIIRGLKAGNYNISVSHANYLEIPEETKSVRQEERVDFKLHGKANIEGSVLERDEVTPIPNASIRLTKLELDKPESEGKTYDTGTDSDGSFRFNDVPSGRYNLSVFKDIFEGESVVAIRAYNTEVTLATGSNKIIIVLDPEQKAGASHYKITNKITGLTGLVHFF